MQFDTFSKFKAVMKLSLCPYIYEFSLDINRPILKFSTAV